MSFGFLLISSYFQNCQNLALSYIKSAFQEVLGVFLGLNGYKVKK